MTNEEIRHLIRTTVANAAGVAPEDIIEEHDLIRDLSLDSLAVYEIVVDLEEAFEMQIADEDVERLHTVKDIAAYIEKRKSS